MDDLIEAIRLEPKYALAYNERGFALVHMGKYDEAVHLKSQYMKAFGGRAREHTLLGKDGRAEEDITRAEELGADRFLLEQDIECLKAGIQVLFD